jgi:hypothetical protein
MIVVFPLNRFNFPLLFKNVIFNEFSTKKINLKMILNLTIYIYIVHYKKQFTQKFHPQTWFWNKYVTFELYDGFYFVTNIIQMFKFFNVFLKI